MNEIEPTTDGRVQRLADEFDCVLESLESAPAFAKVRHQDALFSLASDLMDMDEGVAALIVRAHRFDTAGVFHAGPWEDPSRLVPILVGASLRGDGVYPTVESLSSMRVMALASGRATHSRMSAAEAQAFLAEVSAHNLDYLLPAGTEESRQRPKLFRRARRLFEHVLNSVSPEALFGRVVEEIDLLAAQRPILTTGIEQLVDRAGGMRRLHSASQVDQSLSDRLETYESSLGAVTELARASDDLLDYRKRLRALELDELVAETRAFGRLMQQTGLASPYLAIALRRVAQCDASRVGEALDASESGVSEARRSAELVRLLVGLAIVPDTRFALLGLANALERGVLSRTEVAGGLRKISDLAVRPEVSRLLLTSYGEASGLTGNAVLLAGCLGVLGLPLGVGQGNNPTCQSARGISLWSLHAPGQLLAKVASVARDGFYETNFEGQPIRSDALDTGLLSAGVDEALDPVSQMLVPHLDRVYNYMMAIAAHRGDDAHRWVNPALYGHWVPTGFDSVFEALGGTAHRHESFLRRFYATHHPEHNEGHELIYPNPVGIMVTDSHGRLLGRHAVSLQRVAVDSSDVPEGTDPYRAFFFNPNNEGRQDWGLGVRPAVAGHGEHPGESSLPFAHFASRLYAFHYDPQELGDAFAVPAEVIQDVMQAAAASWSEHLDAPR